MDLNQLEAFDQVLQQGSFSRAARKLNLSQPSISLRIQALEQEVGGALFERGGKRLRLTDLGRSFLPYARQALRAMTTGVEVARQAVRGERGRLVVGTLPTLAVGFFSATLARLHYTHPQLDLIVHTGHNQQIIEMLYDGFVQAGFLTAPFFHPDLDPLLHLREPLLLLTSASHPLARHRQISLSELLALSKPFLQIDWSVEVMHWQTQTLDLLSSPGSVVEVPPQTAHDLLLRGVGSALLTRSLASQDMKDGRLVEVAVADMPAFARESLLVRLKREEALSPALEAFLSALREEARNYVVP